MEQGVKLDLGLLFYAFYYQYLLHRMKASPNKHLRYIQHPFNISKSKSAYSFSRSGRFVQEKTFSPNKFYDLPSTLSQKASKMGFGNKTNFVKADFVEPSRYRISSDFEKTASQKPKANSTFGISRQDYYKGKSSGDKPGPGTYQVSSRQKNPGGYMGYRYEPPVDRHNLSACSYDVNVGLERLSTFRNNLKDCRMKTEYYPKPKYHENKTPTPGPGSYQCRPSMNNSFIKSKPYLFGKEERLKQRKISNTGPGSYHLFSQFGVQ